MHIQNRRKNVLSDIIRFLFQYFIKEKKREREGAEGKICSYHSARGHFRHLEAWGARDCGDCSRKLLTVPKRSVSWQPGIRQAGPPTWLCTVASLRRCPHASALLVSHGPLVSCWHVVHLVVTRPHHHSSSFWIRHHEWSFVGTSSRHFPGRPEGSSLSSLVQLAFLQTRPIWPKTTRNSLKFLAYGYHLSIVFCADASFPLILYSAVHLNGTLINRLRYLRHCWIFPRSKSLQELNLDDSCSWGFWICIQSISHLCCSQSVNLGLAVGIYCKCEHQPVLEEKNHYSQ